MSVTVSHVEIRNVLTRTTGFLEQVSSHSLQPYRGCTFGNSLCGVGCYVQHLGHLLQGRRWGNFLEVRQNTAESYLANCDREARWARKHRQEFSIFCSSATDPFVPQEKSEQVTARLLEAMCRRPPDLLILQTHSHTVTRELPRLLQLNERCSVRVHVSIESDRDRLPGLPPPASSVEKRLSACRLLSEAGIQTLVTVAPLLPIAEPKEFFGRIDEVADGVVIDHFIQGDGSATGTRTRRTPLPAAMEEIEPVSTKLEYRDRMIAIARSIMPGRVGVNIEGFAGQLR